MVWSRKSAPAILSFAAALLAAAAGCGQPPCQDKPIQAMPGGDNNGHVVISVGIQCPGLRVSQYTLSPLSTSVGGTIDVMAAGTDDSSDAAIISYAWSAPTGKFSDPASAHTTYTCTAPGEVTLTVTVSNGDCRAMGGMMVTCRGDCANNAASCDAGVGQ
jgi:hypothetical protein